MDPGQLLSQAKNIRSRTSRCLLEPSLQETVASAQGTEQGAGNHVMFHLLGNDVLVWSRTGRTPQVIAAGPSLLTDRGRSPKGIGAAVQAVTEGTGVLAAPAETGGPGAAAGQGTGETGAQAQVGADGLAEVAALAGTEAACTAAPVTRKQTVAGWSSDPALLPRTPLTGQACWIDQGDPVVEQGGRTWRESSLPTLRLRCESRAEVPVMRGRLAQLRRTLLRRWWRPCGRRGTVPAGILAKAHVHQKCQTGRSTKCRYLPCWIILETQAFHHHLRQLSKPLPPCRRGCHLRFRRTRPLLLSRPNPCCKILPRGRWPRSRAPELRRTKQNPDRPEERGRLHCLRKVLYLHPPEPLGTSLRCRQAHSPIHGRLQHVEEKRRSLRITNGMATRTAIISTTTTEAFILKVAGTIASASVLPVPLRMGNHTVGRVARSIHNLAAHVTSADIFVAVFTQLNKKWGPQGNAKRKVQWTSWDSHSAPGLPAIPCIQSANALCTAVLGQAHELKMTPFIIVNLFYL